MDRFIITKPFTGQKWRPLYNGNLAANKPERTREMSTKTLADVVEALMYVFSEFILPLLNQIYHPETRLGSTYSLDMFHGSLYPLGQARLTLKSNSEAPHILMATTSLFPKMPILCWPRTLGFGDYKRQPLVWRFSCQKYHGPQLCVQARYCTMYTSFRVRYPLVLLKPKR